MCEICSKLNILNTFFLVFLLLTLGNYFSAGMAKYLSKVTIKKLKQSPSSNIHGLCSTFFIVDFTYLSFTYSLQFIKEYKS